jgi:hypothetical protein
VSTPTEALAALAAPDQSRQGRAHTPETGEISAERLADVEAHAVTVRAWNPELLPGLLQTTRYAAAVITSARPSLPREEAQRHAHRRAARVDRFLDRWGARPTNGAWFAVGERAVRRPLVHRSAHRAQLQQLACLADLPNVHLHVVPEDRPVPGSPGQLALYGLDPAHGGERGARLGYVETPVGAWYTLRSADMARLHTVFAAIIEVALDTDDTRSLILEALAHE